MTKLNFAQVKKELKLEGIEVIRVGAVGGEPLYILDGSGWTDGILLTAQEIVEECKHGEIGW